MTHTMLKDECETILHLFISNLGNNESISCACPIESTYILAPINQTNWGLLYLNSLWNDKEELKYGYSGDRNNVNLINLTHSY